LPASAKSSRRLPGPHRTGPESHYFDAKASPEKNPWSAIDVAHVQTFPKVLGLGYLKQQTALAELPLVQKGSRLSVMPVTPSNGPPSFICFN
jgi:predicted RNA-binding protein with PUA-like domain